MYHHVKPKLSPASAMKRDEAEVTRRANEGQRRSSRPAMSTKYSTRGACSQPSESIESEEGGRVQPYLPLGALQRSRSTHDLAVLSLIPRSSPIFLHRTTSEQSRILYGTDLPQPSAPLPPNPHSLSATAKRPCSLVRNRQAGKTLQLGASGSSSSSGSSRSSTTRFRSFCICSP
jgi:hypothetical protein